MTCMVGYKYKHICIIGNKLWQYILYLNIIIWLCRILHSEWLIKDRKKTRIRTGIPDPVALTGKNISRNILARKQFFNLSQSRYG